MALHDTSLQVLDEPVRVRVDVTKLPLEWNGWVVISKRVSVGDRIRDQFDGVWEVVAVQRYPRGRWTKVQVK
jgi:hypothetical protein